MAVKGSEHKSAATMVQEPEEDLIIDINDTSLADGEQQVIDAKEDWQAKAAPPPKGTYRLKLVPGDDPNAFKKALKPGSTKDDPNGYYLTKQVMAKIQDPGGVWDNAVVYYNASSGVPRGKKMSTMAGLMTLGKVKLPQVLTDKALGKLFVKWLAMEPVLAAECDWSAWDTEDKDKRNLYGKSLKVGMLNFPMSADGKTRNHILMGKKGNDVVASLKIVKWVGPSATSLPQSAQVAGGFKPVVAAAAVAAAPKPVPVPVVVSEEIAIDGDIEMDPNGEVVLEA